MKVAKLKTELNFAQDEAAKIADLKTFRLTKELAIAEAEMKAIDQAEDTKEITTHSPKETPANDDALAKLPAESRPQERPRDVHSRHLEQGIPTCTRPYLTE